MANTDFRVNCRFFSHPKCGRLLKSLGYMGEAKLFELWGWAAINKPDGILDMTPADIEFAIHWTGEPGQFVETLLQVGFLDFKDGVYLLHNWSKWNPWAADSQSREEKARLNGMAKNYPDIHGAYMKAHPQASGISKSEYDDIIGTFKRSGLFAVHQLLQGMSVQPAMTQQPLSNSTHGIRNSTGVATCAAPSPNPDLKTDLVEHPSNYVATNASTATLQSSPLSVEVILSGMASKTPNADLISFNQKDKKTVAQDTSSSQAEWMATAKRVGDILADHEKAEQFRRAERDSRLMDTADQLGRLLEHPERCAPSYRALLGLLQARLRETPISPAEGEYRLNGKSQAFLELVEACLNDVENLSQEERQKYAGEEQAKAQATRQADDEASAWKEAGAFQFMVAKIMELYKAMPSYIPRDDDLTWVLSICQKIQADMRKTFIELKKYLSWAQKRGITVERPRGFLTDALRRVHAYA